MFKGYLMLLACGAASATHYCSYTTCSDTEYCCYGDAVCCSDDSFLNVGTIVGVVIGSLVGLALLILCIVCFLMHTSVCKKSRQGAVIYPSNPAGVAVLSVGQSSHAVNGQQMPGFIPYTQQMPVSHSGYAGYGQQMLDAPHYSQSSGLPMYSLSAFPPSNSQVPNAAIYEKPPMPS